MDRFDDIWKDRFNDEALPGQYRMEPDNMVWENIAQATVREEKRKRLFFWIIAGTLSILLMTLFLIQFKPTMFGTQLDNPPMEPSQQLAANNGFVMDTGDLHKNGSNKATSPKNEVANLTSPPNSVDQNDGTATILDKDNTTAIPKSRNKDLMEQRQATGIAKKDTDIFQKSNHRIISYENTTRFQKKGDDLKEAIPNVLSTPVTRQIIPETTTTKSNRLLSLRPLPSLFPVWATTSQHATDGELPDADALTLEATPLHLPIQPITNTTWQLSLQAGISHWQHQISSQYTDDLSAFDFNYKNNTGLLLTAKLSKRFGRHWYIETGLEYEQANVHSGHNSNLSYHTGNEMGVASNTYSTSLATPYGLSAAMFDLKRNTTIGNDELELLVDFHSKHTIRNIGVPLMVKYVPFGSFFNYNDASKNNFKITPTIGIGLGANYLFDISNEIDNLDTHHAAITFDKTNYSFDNPDIQNLHWDYRFAIGATLGWRHNWSLTLNYERIFGINHLFQLNDYQTTINRHHLTAGLQKMF